MKVQSGMKNIKNIYQYDAVTGELLDGVLVHCGVKYNPYASGWLMNSQQALELLSKDKDFKGETLRVLLFLMSRLDFQNLIEISKIEISKELDIHRVNVSKAFKQLIDKGIIIEGPKVGRSFAYKLNPDYGWKGKVKNLNEYRKELEEQEKLSTKHNYLRSYQDNDID